VSEVTLHLPAEFVDAIAEAVAAKLNAATPQREEGEPWALCNVDEACRRLGRSKRWVGEKTRSGELPHVRLDGGAKAYLLRDLIAFAETRRVPLEDGLSLGQGRRLRAVDE
jgi:excisionase family DNA binding protein